MAVLVRCEVRMDLNAHASFDAEFNPLTLACSLYLITLRITATDLVRDEIACIAGKFNMGTCACLLRAVLDGTKLASRQST